MSKIGLFKAAVMMYILLLGTRHPRKEISEKFTTLL